MSEVNVGPDGRVDQEEWEKRLVEALAYNRENLLHTSAEFKAGLTWYANLITAGVERIARDSFASQETNSHLAVFVSGWTETLGEPLTWRDEESDFRSHFERED